MPKNRVGCVIIYIFYGTPSAGNEKAKALYEAFKVGTQA